MLRVTPTTTEEHELALLRSVIAQINRPEGQEILNDLLALPATNNAEEIRALHGKISNLYDHEAEDKAFDIDNPAYDPSKKNYYNALFNLMLLLVKYHPYNDFDDNGNVLGIISLDVIDLKASVLTTHAYFDIPDLYDYLNFKLQQNENENAARDVEEKAQIRNPSSQTIFSDRELAWLRECFLAAPQSCWQKYQNYANLNKTARLYSARTMACLSALLSIPLAANNDVQDLSSNWFAKMGLSLGIVLLAAGAGHITGRPVGVFLGEAYREIFPKEDMRAIPAVEPPQHDTKIDPEQSAIHLLSCIKSSSPVLLSAPQKEAQITVREEERKVEQPASPTNNVSVSSLSFLAHSPESAAAEPLLPTQRPARPNEPLLKRIEDEAKKHYGSGNR